MRLCVDEEAHLAHLLPDADRPFLADEEPLEPLGGDVLGDLGAVDAPARSRERLRVDVGREDLHGTRGGGARGLLAREDGERVRLLVGGAAGHPDPHRRGDGLREERGQDVGGEEREHLRVAEELRHADQQVLEQELRLARVLLEDAQVLGGARRVPEEQAPADSAAEAALLVPAEVVAGATLERRADRPERARDVRVERLRLVVPHLDAPALVLEEQRRHRVDGHREVDEPGVDRALGHVGLLRGRGLLGEREPAALLDRPQPGRPVAPLAGEDHADRVLAALRGERAQERVDGAARPDLRVGGDVEQAALERDHGARRGDVDVVGLEALSRLRLAHGHPRVPPEQLGDGAVLPPVRVHDDHERDAAVARHPAEEARQRVEAARRGADPNHEARGAARERRARARR
jgi:hypothetical protein